MDARLAAIALLGLCGASPEPVATAEPELVLPGIVSTGHDDSHPSFTRDGNTLYFLRNTPDFAHWTVLETHRSGTGWTTPEVAPFSGRWSDADLFVAPDGERLFFISTRPVEGRPKADTDIWVMLRTESGWGEPRHVRELSSPGYEWFPTITRDGTLYFGSERPGGHGKSDLWRARWLGDHFSEPENLGPRFNTPDQEIEPYVAPDESYLIFAARGREPNAGAYDLYVSHHCGDGWTEPEPLGGGVNSPGWDFGPHPSPDGAYLYFTSNRSSIFAEPHDPRLTAAMLEQRLSSPGNGLRDIYRVRLDAIGLDSPCR